MVSILFPLYFIQNIFPGYDFQQYLFRSLGQVVICFLLLLAIFIPKINLLTELKDDSHNLVDVLSNPPTID